MKKILLIFIVIAALVGGCVKYEEGPCMSNLAVKKRIYGFHTIVEYSVNGIDSMSQYYDSLGLRFNFIYDNIANDDVCIIDGSRRDGSSSNLYLGWELSVDKKFIYITETGGTAIGVGPFGVNKMPSWEIIRLGKNNMKLRTFFGNKKYDISLNI